MKQNTFKPQLLHASLVLFIFAVFTIEKMDPQTMNFNLVIGPGFVMVGLAYLVRYFLKPRIHPDIWFCIKLTVWCLLLIVVLFLSGL